MSKPSGILKVGEPNSNLKRGSHAKVWAPSAISGTFFYVVREYAGAVFYKKLGGRASGNFKALNPNVFAFKRLRARHFISIR
jgi:hypothetical protein